MASVQNQATVANTIITTLAEVQPYEDDYLRVEFADLCATHALLGLATPEEAPTERDALATTGSISLQMVEALRASGVNDVLSDALGAVEQRLNAT